MMTMTTTMRPNPPQAYKDLVTALKATKIPCEEYEWETCPKGTYMTVALEFEAGNLHGNDQKVERAFEGSIDLFFKRKADRDNLLSKVENVLSECCGSCWRAERMQHEAGTGYFHQEWVFQVE